MKKWISGSGLLLLITCIWGFYEADIFQKEPVKQSEPVQTVSSDEKETEIQTTQPLMTQINQAIETGENVVIVNNNQPNFTPDDLNLNSQVNTTYRTEFLERQNELDWKDLNQEKWLNDPAVWELFSPLDGLNRAGEANAVLHIGIKPAEKRADRLTINPTGWKQTKIKDNEWLYNRCHLIAYRFTGHNDNLYNLITGTKSFNQTYMDQYETKLAENLYKGKHVRYRVTPVYDQNDLVAKAVQMEAASMEDDSLRYNVLVINRQDGFTIDYTTGQAKKQ